jgi:hypothetical protein
MPMPTIAQFLDAACEELREELHKIDRKIIVTHDSREAIEVYSHLQFKAYVPKTYDGWPVRWAEFGVELTIDLDEELSG